MVTWIHVQWSNTHKFKVCIRYLDAAYCWILPQKILGDNLNFVWSSFSENYFLYCFIRGFPGRGTPVYNGKHIERWSSRHYTYKRRKTLNTLFPEDRSHPPAVLADLTSLFSFSRIYKWQGKHLTRCCLYRALTNYKNSEDNAYVAHSLLVLKGLSETRYHYNTMFFFFLPWYTSK